MDATTTKAELLDQAFAVHPGRDERLPLLERSQIAKRVRRLHARFFARAVEQPVQDATGTVYATWRERRASASRIRQMPPDLAPARAAYARDIGKLVDAARTRDVPIVLLTQPSLWRADLSTELEDLLWLGAADGPREYYSAAAMAEAMAAFNATLLELCTARDVPCLDLATLIPKDERSFYDDLHFNEEGARRVADAVASYLIDNEIVRGTPPDATP